MPEESITLIEQKNASSKGETWKACRGGIFAFGKNKKEAIKNLKETERFVRITNKSKFN